MAKSTFLDFSTTAGDNTDCGGIGILGTNSVSNFDNAFRTLMAILRRDLDNGTVFATKSGAYTAVANDNNAFYEFTATATLTLTAAATLGADWHMMVFANGGSVTIDADGTELINGASTLTIANGDAAYIICTGTAFKAITMRSAAKAAKGHIYGLTLSNNASDATNDIDIAVGEAADDGATPWCMVLSTALTKRLDAAWAVGSGNGGLDTGSIANGTYHVFLIQRSDTGVVDALFSTSASAPTMPANYDRKRRIGSIVRLSATIIPFVHNGDYFGWKTPAADLNVSNPGAAAVTRTLTVPTGIVVNAKISLFMRGSASGSGLLVSSLAATDVAADQISNFTLVAGVSTTSATQANEFTNTSGQIRTRLENSDSNSLIRIATLGYTDTRGRV